MQVEGFITGWEDSAGGMHPSGAVYDAKRTVTFHFRSGYSGQDVTLPWVGPWPTTEDPRTTIWVLTLEPKRESASEDETSTRPIPPTNRPRFTAVPDQTEPGRKVLCRIVDWDGGSENASVEGGNHRVLIDGLTPREAVVGAHELDMMVRTLPKGLPADMLDDLVAFRFPDKARGHDDDAR